VQIVRRAIAASIAVSPDVETLNALLDPNHVLTTDWSADRHEHVGVQGHLEAIAEMVAAWDPWQQEVERVIDAGENGVVALLHLTAAREGERRSGAVLLGTGRDATTRQDGRFACVLDQRQALKAVGLEE
jgi:hypothetical protein